MAVVGPLKQMEQEDSMMFVVKGSPKKALV